jgi:hypothetical protein
VGGNVQQKTRRASMDDVRDNKNWKLATSKIYNDKERRHTLGIMAAILYASLADGVCKLTVKECAEHALNLLEICDELVPRYIDPNQEKTDV